MRNSNFKRWLSAVLAVVMVAGCIPFVVGASDSFVSETHDVFSKTTSTIAPGVTQDIVYAYAKDGKQMAYYIATADISRDDVLVQTSYKDQYVNKQFGMEKLTNQIAFADKLYTDETSDRFISKYYKVVAGVNASFYNMTTGQPSGVTYLDGVQIGESASYNQFFAVLKDGTAVVDYTKNLSKYKDNIDQAVAGSQMLVFDGKDITVGINGSYNTDRHSRTCIGVTADGKVVVMSLDGRQEPFSCGGTMHELAQIMLEAGCVAAINLDGGGSTTFAARQEGEDKVTIVNRPSDGSERSISSGIIIASLAVPSNVFERATLTAENTYVTPGSAVKVIAKGVSPAGTAAEIPSDAVWQMKDSSMGTVNNGVFTSSGKAGAAVVQMAVNGNVVGETTINVVIPEAIAFNNAEIVVPYDKTVAFEMTATYGLNEVVMKAGDVVFQMADNAIGSISGFDFTAASEGVAVTSTDVVATLAFDEKITASAKISLGKGSEVIYDFEDGTTGGILFTEPAGTAYNYTWPESNQWVVDSATGRVHNGNNALAMKVNYSNSLESGYMKTSVVAPTTMVFENAARVGMWIYIPDEAVGLWARWTINPVASVDANGIPTFSAGITGQDLDGVASGGSTGYVSTFAESGWHYLSIDTSMYSAVGWKAGNAIMQFYISDRDGASFGYDASDYSNIIGDFTFYVDDITVDYSSAVDDREAPVFTSVRYSDPNMSDAVELIAGKAANTVFNTISFGAVVHENTTKTNYTGIDAASAKAYIDGVEVESTYAGGIISIADANLTNGLHTVKFSICDMMGNYSSVVRTINVNSQDSASTVKLVAADDSLDRILFGSVYNMNLVATEIADVKKVEITVDLDSLSTWELDHMTVAAGFEATYTIIEDENIAVITIVRTGKNNDSGEAILATLPARVWELKMGYKYENGTKAGADAFTYEQFKNMKEFWRLSLIAEVDAGILTRIDDSTSTFSGERVFADTEMWAEDADMIATSEGMAYYNSWNGGHIHTAYAIADKAASCTEAGYTGRTYCKVCDSVVDWGEAVAAEGHNYDLVDGALKCACGDLFSGVYTDGKTYADGIIVNGWSGDYYYVDGVMNTGVAYVDGYYYDFGTDGVSKGKYTGLIEKDGYKYYAKFGELVCGWVLVGNDNYYFGDDYKAVGGTDVRVGDYTYSFNEEFVLVKGQWGTDAQGRTRYIWAGKALSKQFAEIDGNTYYFDGTGVLCKGDQYIKMTHGDVPYMYYISDEGVVGGKMTGFTGIHKSSAGVFAVEDGVATYAGIVQDDEGNFYYINSAMKAVTNCSYSVSESKANGLVPAGRYTFDSEGKMINPPVIDPTPDPEPEEPDTPVVPDPEVKNGLVKDEDGAIRYYVDGVATYAGVVKDNEGNLYYINSSKKAVTGCAYSIGTAKTNGLVPAGRYEFDAEGKMLNAPGSEPEEPDTPVVPDPNLKNGLIKDEDGAIRYYVNGEAIYAGVVKDEEGNFYYINSSKKAVTGCVYSIGTAKTNGLVPAGRYEFDAEGKMLNAPGSEPEEPDTPVVPDPDLKNGLIKDEDGAIRYYVNGEAIYAGVVKDEEGNFYYINSSKKAVTDCSYGIGSGKTNGLVPAGRYKFDAEGKMINPPVA